MDTWNKVFIKGFKEHEEQGREITIHGRRQINEKSTAN